MFAAGARRAFSPALTCSGRPAYSPQVTISDSSNSGASATTRSSIRKPVIRPHVRSVSVSVNDPTLADAAATALFVAGPRHWQEIAVAMGIDDVLLVEDADKALVTPCPAAEPTYARRPAANTVVTLAAHSP